MNWEVLFWFKVMLTPIEAPADVAPACVIVAEADPLIAEGLAQGLTQTPWLTARPLASSAREALDTAQNSYPAVLLLSEPLLQNLPSEELAGKLEGGRAVRVLVLGNAPDTGRTLHYLLLGCMGYLSRQDSLETLRKAVTAVAAGEFWAPRGMLPELVRELRDRRSREPALTGREREILSLIHAGRTNGQIAGLLFISHETVRWHVRRVFSKIGAGSRAAAVEFAGRHGVVWRGSPLPPVVATRGPLQIVSRAG